MNGLPSTRSYLIRALHQWCMDHGFTPHIAVKVDDLVQVPQQYVVNGEIVLNVSTDATSGLLIGQDHIEFKARFGGVAQQIMLPVDHVIAIYSRENGQGMAFLPPVLAVSSKPTLKAQGDGSALSLEDSAPSLVLVEPSPDVPDANADATPTGDGPNGGKPSLRRIK
jgi:stringent starvation protein B